VLVHERPYKDAFSVEDAAAEIEGGAGTQFDPEVVEAFADLGPRVWLAAPGVYGG
jgi:HD-GYP domain-containing protein (c-di-GMP phosphodiesterase class II)